MALGFFTSDNAPDTYEARERRRRMAEALIAQSQDYSPVGSWTQGAARLAQALSGNIQAKRLDAKDKESSAAFNELTRSLIGGGSMPSPSPSPSMASAPPGGGSPGFSGSQADFVAAITPHAQKVAQETGLDPRLVIAQAALESGWGKSAPGNNFFGIKSHGQPGGNTLATTEVVNGQPVQTRDSFRAYADMGESAKGYADFLRQNPRYRELLGAQGLDNQIAALARSGYATDPMYGNKIAQIARGIQLPEAAPAPVQVAQSGMTPDGMPTSPVASDAPPMAYAPGGAPQAINNAMPQNPPMPPPRPGAALTQAVAPTAPPIPAPQPTGNVQAALYQIISDPRFSPQQKAQAMQLFQLGQRDNTPLVVPEGSMLYDRNTRQMIQAGGAKPTDRQRDYNFYVQQEAAAGRPPKSFADWDQQQRRAGATNINTGPTTPKQVFDTMIARSDEVRASAGALPSFEEAKRLIDSGQITLGAGADMRVAMQKVGALFGMDGTAASNAETFRATIAPTVLAMVKGLGAGSGISNADREFAEKAAGGNINLEPASIRRLIDLGQKAAKFKLDAHNAQVDRLFPDGNEENRQARELLRVTPPPMPEPPPTPEAQRPEGPRQPPRPGQVIDGYRFKGGDPSRRENWEQVR